MNGDEQEIESGKSGCADAGGVGCGVRRHRDQPAVHHEGSLQPGHGHSAGPDAPHRRGVRDFLGAHDGCDPEIRAPHPAR